CNATRTFNDSESNLETNILSILAFASTRSTWVSIASCIEKTGVSYDSVRQYMMIDEFGPVASRFHYDYRIRLRGARGGTTFYISVVNRGWAGRRSRATFRRSACPKTTPMCAANDIRFYAR